MLNKTSGHNSDKILYFRAIKRKVCWLTNARKQEDKQTKNDKKDFLYNIHSLIHLTQGFTVLKLKTDEFSGFFGRVTSLKVKAKRNNSNKL